MTQYSDTVSSLALPSLPYWIGGLVVFLIMASLGACQSGDQGEKGEANGPPVVDVTAVDYAFAAPDSIPSGWVTFRLNNEKAEEVHEIDLSHLPEGISYSDFEKTIPVWGPITDRVQSGELVGPGEVYAAAGSKLPDWSEAAEEVTGRGLVAPGRVTEKTVYMEPGTYAMYCFVKSPDGQSHISRGMARELVVSDDDTTTAAPNADVEVVVAGDEIDTDGALASGTNAIAARFKEDSKGYQTIHLIRMEEETNLEDVETWLNWYRKDGLMAPTPADFLGGNTIQRGTPNGDVAYFSVEDVEPGQYAWVVWTFEGAFSETFTVE